MDYYTLVFGSFFALIMLYILRSSKSGSKRLPPGPSPWPIIGNLHLLGAKPHISLAQLATTYGPIMSLRLGQITTIVISSPAMAKEVLQKQDLAFSSNRFVPDALKARNHHQFSVPWLPIGPRWRTLRRIMNSNLFSSNCLDANQHLRSQKVKELLVFCERCSQVSKVVDIGQAAFKTNVNLLSNTVFSKDMVDPFSDAKVELKEVIWSVIAEIGKPNLVDFFPILEKIDPQGIRRRITILSGKLLKLLDGLINERLEEKRTSCSEKNDILEVLLNMNAEDPEVMDQNCIKPLLMDIFGGGTDTSTSTLEWVMAEMLRHPEIMKKAQVELAEVIGKGKQVEEADISKLAYLQCIIKESLRLHGPVALLAARKVDEDVDLCGYIVPKGSQVLVNAWAIGRDSTSWEDPLVFKPERFWNLDLDVRGQDFELIPFGAGRRICPGMTLALRMVTVTVGSLLNCFNWKLEAGISPEDLDMEEKFGISLAKAIPLRAIPSPL